MDIALVIEKLIPSAKYLGSVTSNTRKVWELVDWKDIRIPKPTWEELVEVWKIMYKESQIEALNSQVASLDSETSDSIISGFDYQLPEFDLYHFSYDLTDQQNFSDAANIATLMKLGLPGLPETVKWNAWTFIEDSEGKVSKTMTRIELTAELLFELYGAAIVHKQTQLEIGTIRKQELLASFSLEEWIEPEEPEPVENIILHEIFEDDTIE